MRFLVHVLESIFLLIALIGELGLVNAPDTRKVSAGAIALLWVWKDVRKESFLLPWLKSTLHGLHSRRFVFWGVFGVAGTIALLFVLTKSFALGFSTFDTGIFHQLMWSLSQGMGFHSSLSRAVDFLRDHCVLSLALLSPLYGLFNGAPPVTPVLSALLLLGGIAALLSAFRARWKSSGMAFGLGMLAILLSQALWANLGWGFHENHLGVFGLCVGLSLWIRSGERISRAAYGGAVCAFLLAALAKESLLLQMGTVFLVWGLLDPVGHFRERDGLRRGILVGIGAALLAGFVYYAKLPKHAEKNYFSSYFGYLGSSLDEVVLSLVTSPGKVMATVGFSQIFWYLAAVLVLGGFFFLLERRARVNAMLIPLLVPVGMALIAQYEGLRNPGMHYILEVLPLLWFVSLWHLSRGVGRKAAPVVWVLAVVFFFSISPVRDIRRNLKSALEFSEFREVLRSIPRDRVVMADAAPGVWLSDRPWIVTWWPSLEGLAGRCPELYVVYAPDEITRARRLEEMQALGAQCTPRAKNNFQRIESLSRAGFEFYEPAI